MDITKSSFNKAKTMIKDGKEGLVLLGCAGDHNEWVEGVSGMLIDELDAKPDFLNEVHLLTTTGGRHDLVLMFDSDKISVGKLAMWRLSFGDCSWLSDYVVNYRDHHKKKVAP